MILREELKKKFMDYLFSMNTEEIIYLIEEYTRYYNFNHIMMECFEDNGDAQSINNGQFSHAVSYEYIITISNLIKKYKQVDEIKSKLSLKSNEKRLKI